MEAKYYTPEYHEFHEGFEYGDNFFNTDFTQKTFSFWEVQNPEDRRLFIKAIDNKQIRVKFLDREDIESLGFEKRIRDQWAFFNDFILNTIDGDYGYFLYCTIHAERPMGKSFKIYVHRYLDGSTNDIINQIDSKESEMVYKGAIKNKTELKSIQS